MNCSVYTPSFLPYKNSHPHQLSSFRIDDILKTQTSISPTFIDPTTLWSSFAAQLLAYSPELLSVATTTTTTSPSTDISPPIPNLISPQKHHHHHVHNLMLIVLNIRKKHDNVLNKILK